MTQSQTAFTLNGRVIEGDALQTYPCIPSTALVNGIPYFVHEDNARCFAEHIQDTVNFRVSYTYVDATLKFYDDTPAPVDGRIFHTIHNFAPTEKEYRPLLDKAVDIALNRQRTVYKDIQLFNSEGERLYPSFPAYPVDDFASVDTAILHKGLLTPLPKPVDVDGSDPLPF